MSTSGTATFNPDWGELFEEAYERAGLEGKTGYDLRTLRRSANLLSIEWQNRGLNYFAIDMQVLALTAGTATYALAADTLDVLDGAIRQNDGNASTQSDITTSRIPFTTYLSIPNKLTRGMPVQFTVNRAAAPSITFWPVPDRAGYSFAHYRIRRIQDAGGNLNFTADVASRFLEALVAGLALRIAEKRPEVSPDRVGWLKQRYEEQFELATQEDRDRSVLRIVPGGYGC